MIHVTRLRPDWWNKKEYAVLKAVQTFGTVQGRKALHKILYFADLQTRMFKYQWYTYGPYSPELAYKIADHVCDKSLNVAEDDSGGMTRYDMSLSASGAKLLEMDSHHDVDSALARTHALLRDMSPRQMELLASVHYIGICGYERREAGQILHDLKPASDFADNEVEWAIKLLENGALVELEAVAAPEPRRR